MKFSVPNLLSQPFAVFDSKKEMLKKRFTYQKEAGSFHQLIQIGGYTMKWDMAALEKMVAQICGEGTLTKGAFLALATSVLNVVKIDKTDQTDEAITYADAVERARLLYAGYIVRSDHPSPDWPRVGIMPGVLAIMGETKTGKSTYIKNTNVDLIIRASEPYESFDKDPRVLQVGTFTQAFAIMVLCALGEVKCAIDSLRALIFNLKGNAGEGGVSTAIYELLTTLNNISAEFGALTIAAINPMIADEERALRLFIRIEASIAGLVEIKSGAAIKGSFRRVDGTRVEHAAELAASEPQFASFSRDLPNHHSVDLMMNVDALGGDTPRSRIAAIGVGRSDTPESDDSSFSRQFPSIPFSEL